MHFILQLGDGPTSKSYYLYDSDAISDYNLYMEANGVYQKRFYLMGTGKQDDAKVGLYYKTKTIAELIINNVSGMFDVKCELLHKDSLTNTYFKTVEYTFEPTPGSTLGSVTDFMWKLPDDAPVHAYTRGIILLEKYK